MDAKSGEQVEGTRAHWDWEWWAIGSGAQLLWGIRSYRRGYESSSSSSHRLMPIKAWAVATLFVGSGASAFIAALRASGIRKVEDFSELGANMRTRLGIPHPPNTTTTTTTTTASASAAATNRPTSDWTN